MLSIKACVRKLKRQAVDWEEIFTSHRKGYVSRIYEALFKHSRKKTCSKYKVETKPNQTKTPTRKGLKRDIMEEKKVRD